MTIFENGLPGCFFVRIGDKRGVPVPVLYRWDGLNLETTGPHTVPGAGEGEAHVVLVDSKGKQVAEILLGHMAEDQTATFPGGSFIRLNPKPAQDGQNSPPAAVEVPAPDSEPGQ